MVLLEIMANGLFLWDRREREVAVLGRFVSVSNGMGILTVVCFVGLLLKGNKLHSSCQMSSD